MNVLPWNHKHRVYSRITGDSRTLQSERDTSDVNYIVQRFQRTGEMPKNPRGLEGQYIDVTHLQEELTEAYNDALQRADEAQNKLREAKAKAAKERERVAAEERSERDNSPLPDQQEGRAARAESTAQPSETP